MAKAKSKAKTKAKAKKVKTDADDGKTRIRPNTEDYKSGRSASGKKTQHCGDMVAEVCDGMTVEELAAVAQAADVAKAADLIDQYSHLNYGQQVMCIRNKIRGAVNQQDKSHEEDKSHPTGEDSLEDWAAKSVAARDKRQATAEKAKEKAEKEKAKKKAA